MQTMSSTIDVRLESGLEAGNETGRKTLTLSAIVSARAACMNAFLACVDERRPHSILYVRLPCRSAQDRSWGVTDQQPPRPAQHQLH